MFAPFALTTSLSRRRPGPVEGGGRGAERMGQGNRRGAFLGALGGGQRRPTAGRDGGLSAGRSAGHKYTCREVDKSPTQHMDHLWGQRHGSGTHQGRRRTTYRLINLYLRQYDVYDLVDAMVAPLKAIDL